MTINQKNSFRLLLFSLLAGAVLSCTSPKKGKNKEQEAVTAEEIKEMVEREFKYPIPTSFEVTQLLQDADAAFVLGVTNPVENVDKYETRRAKALNLGIYGADLSYVSTYNKKEETMKILQASKSLIDGMEISNVFTQEMADQVEANVDNKDTLISIITKSFYDTYNQLKKNGQDKLALLVIAGSWIEALYITSQLAISSGYDKRIMDIVGNQKIAARKLAELCETYKDDEDVKSILPLIRFMNLVYDGVIEDAGITEGQLDDIMENVTSTRREIVE